MRFPRIHARRAIAIVLAAAIAASTSIAAFATDDSSTDPDSALTASPETQTVYPGRHTSYGIQISRLHEFRGPVRLNVRHVPTGTAARWILSDGTESNLVPSDVNRARLLLRTSWTTPIGSRALTITGASRRPDGTRVTRSVDVNLTVQRLFTITGRFQRPLYPGLTERLNLALTNPNAFDVNVTRAQVQLTGTDRPGCGTGNFAIAQIPLSAYPMTLRAGETQRLRDLGLASTQMPRIKMIDSTQNQDACKGAELTLTYRGRGQW